MQTVPNLIHVGEQIMTLDFHPTENIVAVGCIEGDLKCYRFETIHDNKMMLETNGKGLENEREETNKSSFCSSLIFSSIENDQAKNEKKKDIISLRSVQFTPTSNDQNAYIACGYSNGTLRRYNLSTKSLDWEVIEGHDHGITAIKYWHRESSNFLEEEEDNTNSSTKSRKKKKTDKDKHMSTAINNTQFLSKKYDRHDGNQNLLITADEEGCIKIWDCQQYTPIHVFKKRHEDFIADLVIDEKRNILIASSGDCTLSVYDLKGFKFLQESMDQEDEMYGGCILKNGQKIVFGSQSGALMIYSRDQMANCDDRFVGHPDTVQTIVKIDESTIMTGCADGLIRICSIQPNNLFGVLGNGQYDDTSIEILKISHDGTILGSTSHDDAIRLWDISFLQEDEDDGEEENEDDGEKYEDDHEKNLESIGSNKTLTTEEESVGTNEDDLVVVNRRSNQNKKNAKSLPLLSNNLVEEESEKTNFKDKQQKSMQKNSKRKLSQNINEGHESKEPDLSDPPDKQKFDNEIQLKADISTNRRHKKLKSMDDTNKGKKKNKDPRQKTSNEIFFADL